MWRIIICLKFKNVFEIVQFVFQKRFKVIFLGDEI